MNTTYRNLRICCLGILVTLALAAVTQTITRSGGAGVANVKGAER